MPVIKRGYADSLGHGSTGAQGHRVSARKEGPHTALSRRVSRGAEAATGRFGQAFQDAFQDGGPCMQRAFRGPSEISSVLASVDESRYYATA